jgi:hypothetical protein
MKKTSMTLLAALSLSLVGADEGARTAPVQQETNGSRVYAGPDAFWSHYKDENEKLKENVVYGGLRFGYEFLKPDSFYAATDAVAALGHLSSENNGVKVKSDDDTKFTRQVREAFRGNRGIFWSNIEQRFGYTFGSSFLPSSTVSVFAGPGFHYEHEHKNNAHWWYAMTGLKTMTKFTENFDLGAEVKVMYNFAANDGARFDGVPTTLSKKEFWGYEVGVPFKWTVGESKAFDIQLRPYLLKLNVNSPENILGTRLELGYNF